VLTVKYEARESEFESATMNKKSPQGILTKIARFRRDRRGISAVEFAFVFPVMVVLYLGGTALTQGITIKRKTTLATRTVGDLVSQYTQIVDTDMTSILSAATAVVQPYPTGQLSVIVSSVNIDANGAATIGWSSSTSNTTPHTVGASVTLPTGIGGVSQANTSVIWSEGSYAYTLPVGSTIIGRSSMTLSEQFYLRPRRVTTVKRCTSGTCP
jgi:Flp pilus assembly protein TadG